jgi:hypothetical protein
VGLATGGLFVSSISPDPWFLRTLLVLFAAGILTYLAQVRSGRRLFMRRIPGLDKIDEAVGRSVEMGRPVWFVPGIGGLADPGTLTAMGLLERVAALCARYNVRLLVAVCHPDQIPVMTNIVREAFRAENRLESYNEDDIRYLPGGQFYFAIAAMGWMRREKIAASLLFGYFAAEALMLSETAQQIGAVQIAGTHMPMQIPFLIATCDYVLIVEEYLAAHAYVVREPVHLASIRVQDLMKTVMILIMALGVVSATLVATGATGFNWVVEGLEKFLKPVREQIVRFFELLF